MFEPLVSIIIPVYNGSNYMREAIDSALAQTYSNVEVIVVNDGSNDGGATEKIALSYGSKIRYFAKENGGVSSALNMGIKEMRGKFFSWLSHDDVYENDKIEKQIKALNQYGLSDNAIVCCDAGFIDEFSQPLSKKVHKSGFEPYKVYNSNEVLKELLTNITFNGCCLLIPQKIFDECGMFDENLRFCQDAFMWYKIFMKDNCLLCTEDISVKSRIHAKQLTQTGQALFRKECAEISNILAEDLSSISTPDYNFFLMYLLSDAKYFKLNRVRELIAIGKKGKLISKKNSIRIYFVYCYGVIRPTIRKIYYAVFRRMKTA